jgi:spore maturation protein CgeB
MRVGVVGAVEPDYFADNVGDALGRLGHIVTYLGPPRVHHRSRHVVGAVTVARRAIPRLEDLAQQRIVRTALAAECELVINLDAHLAPSAVTRLRCAGIRTALWFPDAVSNLGRQLMLLAPYDALFFKDPHIVERLSATLDVPVYYLPEACNPRWHRPVCPAGTAPYLVVAGNMYPSRVKLLERLIAKGIPLQLYGTTMPGWIGETPARAIHSGRSVFREDKAKVFRSAAGVLNSMHPAEVIGVNARLFEAAGCGAAVVTEFRPAVPELFEIGTEVLVYRDFDELVYQATRLLNETGLSPRLGDAASRRAHRDHSYDRRLATIVAKIS